MEALTVTSVGTQAARDAALLDDATLIFPSGNGLVLQDVESGSQVRQASVAGY
jgi:hypothetical protein